MPTKRQTISSDYISLGSSGELPLLTREEESSLIRAAQAGDGGAEDQLVRRNNGLAITLARLGARRYRADFDTAYAAALLGLLIGIRKFDFSHGTKLSTYATQRIRDQIQQDCWGSNLATRVPMHVRKSMQRITSGKPSSVPSENLEAAVRVFRSGANGDNGLDRVKAREEPDQPQVSEHESQQLRFALWRLNDTEREVIRARFPNEGDPEPYRAIGKRLGISHEWIRTYSVRAVGKLQQLMGRRTGS